MILFLFHSEEERVKFLTKHCPHLEPERTHEGSRRDRQLDRQSFGASDKLTEITRRSGRWNLSLNEARRVKMAWFSVRVLKPLQRQLQTFLSNPSLAILCNLLAQASDYCSIVDELWYKPEGRRFEFL
jgi:hypothetical protein